MLRHALIALVAAAAGLAGCQNTPQRDYPGVAQTRTVAYTPPNGGPVQHVPRMEQGWYPYPERAPAGPEDFFRRAVTANLLEIEMGRIAEARAEDERVRSFATRMIRDHEMANQRLIDVAGAHGVRVPEQLNLVQRDMLEDISQFSGAAFDLRYMQHMVMEHERLLQLLDMQSRDDSMPLAQVAVAGIVPMIQEHLRIARDLLAQLEAGGAQQTVAAPADAVNIRRTSAEVAPR